MSNFTSSAAFLIPLKKEHAILSLDTLKSFEDNFDTWADEWITKLEAQTPEQIRSKITLTPLPHDAKKCDKLGHALFQEFNFSQYDADMFDPLLLVQYSEEQGGLLFHSTEEFNPLHAQTVTQFILRQFDVCTPVCINIGHVTSKADVSGNGGTAMIITKSEIKSFSTKEWLEQQVALFDDPSVPYW